MKLDSFKSVANAKGIKWQIDYQKRREDNIRDMIVRFTPEDYIGRLSSTEFHTLSHSDSPVFMDS